MTGHHTVVLTVPYDNWSTTVRLCHMTIRMTYRGSFARMSRNNNEVTIGAPSDKQPIAENIVLSPSWPHYLLHYCGSTAKGFLLRVFKTFSKTGNLGWSSSCSSKNSHWLQWFNPFPHSWVANTTFPIHSLWKRKDYAPCRGVFKHGGKSHCVLLVEIQMANYFFLDNERRLV